MQKPAIDTIVFDLGGVLIDWNPKYLYRKIFETEAEIDQFLSTICVPEWNALQDAGRSLEEATEELVAKHPDWEAQIRPFYGRWEEMLGGPIHETVEILERVIASPQYRVYALTNWSHETFPVAQARYEFLSWFEGIVVSGEEKLAKPDPKLYKVLFDRYNINPETAVFIDDSLPNVASSNALGMRAIQFKSPMQLRERLAELL